MQCPKFLTYYFKYIYNHFIIWQYEICLVFLLVSATYSNPVRHAGKQNKMVLLIFSEENVEMFGIVVRQSSSARFALESIEIGFNKNVL